MAQLTRFQRLASDRNVWLAATRADGRPHLTPIWFLWAEDRLWMCTGRSAVKARIVAARPNVSFALEDGNQPVSAEGLAELVEVTAAPSTVIDGFRTKFSWDITSADEDLGDLILIAVSVTKWMNPSSEVVPE